VQAEGGQEGVELGGESRGAGWGVESNGGQEFGVLGGPVAEKVPSELAGGVASLGMKIINSVHSRSRGKQEGNKWGRGRG